MDPQRWQRLKELVEGAAEEAPEQRRAYLERTCPNDAALRAEAESLLLHHQQAGSFLESAPLGDFYGLAKAALGRATFDEGDKVSDRFQVVRFLGRGGMGEVYEARDLELGADIALKTLRPEISADAWALERFKKEIQLARRITHPNVCRMFDIARHHLSADGDPSSDLLYFTMELLRGEALSARLRRQKKLSLAEAVPIIRQMAEGLEAAHQAGVVHRDFKPSNIFLESENGSGGISRVVITDFGLARAALPAIDGQNLEQSLTATGQLLGTLAYMAPEQLEGRESTPATDIYALGLVIYEMLAGARPFPEDSPLAGVLHRLTTEPVPLCARAPSVDHRCGELVQRCLQMDPQHRFQSVGELAAGFAALEKKSSVVIRSARSQIVRRARAVAGPLQNALRKRWTGWAVAGVFLVAVVLLALAASFTSRSLRPVHAVIPKPPKLILDVSGGDTDGPPVLSPDGTKIVFVGHYQGASRMVWVRALDATSAAPLAGTEDAFLPFWSPDGQSIGYFANGKLRRIPASGGPATALADAPQGRGGAWSKDDVILYAPRFDGNIWRVSAAGGKPKPVTTLDRARHTTHRWPWFLPDGKHFVYLATHHSGGTREQNGIYFASLDGPENRLLVATDAGAQFASGYLLYHSQNSLLAQRFDPEHGTLSGQPIALAEGVLNDGGVFRAVFSASDSGALVYQLGTAAWTRDMVWYDRSGRVAGKLGDAAPYEEFSLSPDGRKVAMALGDNPSQIWVVDVALGTRTRLSFHENSDFSPSWSRDAKIVAYHSTTNPPRSSQGLWPAYWLKTRFADGHGEEKILADSSQEGASYMTPQLSPDGKVLVYRRYGEKNAVSIAARHLSGDGKPFTIVPAAKPPAEIGSFHISPDGHWLAYTSNDSGKWAIYVVSFPSGSGKWQVSSDTATSPFWRHDGKELFFLGPENATIYGASVVASGPKFAVGKVSPLFTLLNVGGTRPTDSACDTADGRRFLCLADPMEAPPQWDLVLNWDKHLVSK